MLDLSTTLLILGAAVVLDLAMGEPPNRAHPTVWMGRLIGWAVPRLRHPSSSPRTERARGAVFAIALITLVFISAHYLLQAVGEVLGWLALAVLSVLMLKSTIAIRSMEIHARAVMRAVAAGDLPEAKRSLARIVGRETSHLDEQHILSATVESVSESTVDGVTAPLFHYALFGVPGALAYRAINTLDSMIGYRDEYHGNIGLFSARLDTLTNYIPARITSFLMVIAARMAGADWRNSMRILRRDKRKTPSLNAGWPISSVAGALRVRLEKVGYYSLGEGYEHLTLQHCEKAIRIMKITALLFGLVFVVPAIALLSLLAGW
ncbi:MAG: cobalamin biosynthesis protein [Nitrososphaerales archaeon]